MHSFSYINSIIMHRGRKGIQESYEHNNNHNPGAVTEKFMEMACWVVVVVVQELMNLQQVTSFSFLMISKLLQAPREVRGGEEAARGGEVCVVVGDGGEEDVVERWVDVEAGEIRD